MYHLVTDELQQQQARVSKHSVRIGVSGDEVGRRYSKPRYAQQRPKTPFLISYNEMKASILRRRRKDMQQGDLKKSFSASTSELVNLLA